MKYTKYSVPAEGGMPAIVLAGKLRAPQALSAILGLRQPDSARRRIQRATERSEALSESDSARRRIQRATERSEALSESENLLADLFIANSENRSILEVQVCNEGDYIERVMFYWAKEFASALPAGASSAELPEETSGKDELLLWLALFNAETEEELEQIKALEAPEMEQAMPVLNISFAKRSKCREPFQRQ